MTQAQSKGALRPALAAGALVALLQAIILTNWHAHPDCLTWIMPAMGPVLYSATLGFLAGGLGLMAVAFGRFRLAGAAGLLTTALGLLALGHYLGVAPSWAWLSARWTADGAAASGRLLPAGAISLLLVGAALLLSGFLPGHNRRALMQVLAGSLVAAIGAAALLASVSRLAPLERWGDGTPMGTHSSASLLATGLGLVLVEWRRSRAAAALLAGAVVLAAALYLSHVLHWIEHAQLARHIELAVTRVSADLSAAVDSRLLALDRMGRRWEVGGSLSRQEWESDAALYLRDIPGFQALAWADARPVIRWTAPASSPVFAELDPASDPRLIPVLEAARKGQRLALSAPLRRSDGGWAALAIRPLFPRDRFEGYVLGLLDYRNLLTAALSRTIAAGFVIAVSDQKETIFLSSAGPEASAQEWAMEGWADVGGRQWSLRVWPRPGWVTTRWLALPVVVAGFGLVIASLLSLSIYWGQAARQRALEAEAANRELEREVAERKQAQEKLAQARDLLELRVRQRTAELAEANEALKAEIRERQHTEETLRASERRYRNLFDSANDIVYTHDLHGNFTSINRTAERITGYTREEALRMNIADLVAPEHLELVRQMIARKLGGEVTTLYELTILTRDRRRLVVEITSYVVFEEGKPAGILGIAREVTERKRLEEQLRQSQKIEAIGRLAGGIAHDFNNLLTIIGAYSHMLLMDLPEDRTVRGYAHEILAAAERASALTDRLLAFSRRQVIQPVLVDLNELIRNMAGLLRRMVGDDIELTMTLDPELGKIRADPTQLEQVIMNLVVNSRDAMPEGGKLFLETSALELEHGQPGGPEAGKWVVLKVRDTGHGMEAETRSHLFEPFFTTKGPGRGTGLGLAIVYGSVKQCGGEITVWSEPGVGTAFTIYLPRAEAVPVSAQARPQEEFVPGGAATILLVEDEPGVRKLVRQMLAQQGYHVLEAGNGPDSLALVERYPGRIDLLLTDVVMPQMNGRELAEKLTSLRPGLKVMYMTGYTEDAVVRHGVASAGLVCLQKPFLLDTLARKVSEVLERAE